MEKKSQKQGIIHAGLQTLNEKSQNTKIENHWGKWVKKITKNRHDPSRITEFECKIPNHRNGYHSLK